MSFGDIDPEHFVQIKLEMLRHAPARNLEKAVEGRESFLAQARLASARVNPHKAVSANATSRRNGWIDMITNPFRRKEHHSMVGAFTSIVIMLALLLGSAGATVYAAQDSLPDEGLYPIKLASEELQLRLAKSEQKQLALQLAFADRRVGELENMLVAGEPAPEQVANRLENHLRQALQLAAGMEADALLPALLQIRNHIHSEQRLMEMLGNNPAAASDPVLIRVRSLLLQHINQVDAGIAAPQDFHNLLRYQNREMQTPSQPETTPSPAATGNSYGPSGSITRPATQACDVCTPAMDGTGPGPGPGPLEFGQTPEPGYGPGPLASPSPPPGGSGGGAGGSPTTTQEPGQEPGGGGNPGPSQPPGGQAPGNSTPGGGQGRP